GGNPTATESFGASSFDVNLSSSLSRVGITNANVAANWRPNNPAMSNVADQGGTPIPNIFTGGDNADLGTANDLLGIVQDVDGGNLGKTVDPTSLKQVPYPRQAIVKSSPFKLGSVYVLFNSGGTTAG